MAKQNKETHKRADQISQLTNKIKSQLARYRFILLPRFLHPPKLLEALAVVNELLTQLCLNTNLMLFLSTNLAASAISTETKSSCIRNDSSTSVKLWKYRIGQENPNKETCKAETNEIRVRKKYINQTIKTKFCWRLIHQKKDITCSK